MESDSSTSSAKSPRRRRWVNVISWLIVGLLVSPSWWWPKEERLIVRVAYEDQRPVKEARVTARWGDSTHYIEHALDLEWEGTTKFYVDLANAPWKTETLETQPDRYDLILRTESHGTIQRELRCEDREVELTIPEPAFVTIRFTARLPESQPMNELGLSIVGASEANDYSFATFRLDDILIDGAAEVGPLSPGRFRFSVGVWKFKRAANAPANSAKLHVLGSAEAEIASGWSEVTIAPRER